MLSRQSERSQQRATAKVRGDGNESSEKKESTFDLISPIVWRETQETSVGSLESESGCRLLSIIVDCRLSIVEAQAFGISCGSRPALAKSRGMENVSGLVVLRISR